VAKAISSVDQNLIYVALAGEKGQMMSRIGKEFGLNVALEAFPDRAYTPEGTLAPRNFAGAVITDPDEVSSRALKIASEGCIEATNGDLIELRVQTLCVHGDNPHAVQMVKEIRQKLERNNIAINHVKS